MISNQEDMIMAFDLNASKIAMLENMIKIARPMDEMLGVKGKVAIVTGGTSGLGFNIALRLLQGGANVVLATFLQDEGDFTLDLLEKQGYGPDRVTYVRTDVTVEEDMENLVKVAAETFGSVDIYVNTAATWSYAHIYDLSLKEFERVMRTNVNGSFLGIKYVSRYMIEHEIKGKITLISSNVPWIPYPVFGGYPHYAASKGAINALVVEAAKELKRYGIMVNAVAPGQMVTAGSAGNLCAKDLDEDKADEFYEELMVWQTDGRPEVDTVAIVAYSMCTAMADGMTGTCVVADAGMSHNIVSFQPEIEQYPPEEF